jgi:arginine decarboxylase
MEKRARMKRKGADPFDRWSREDAVQHYGLERWSRGLFSVNAAGHVVLRPGDGRTEIDLKALVDEIRMRGLDLPVLIRFTDILRRRIGEIADAFRSAIRDHEYGGEYRGVYPIKVNQHRQVIEDIVRHGAEAHVGLEAGSKPELLVALAHNADPEAPVICNGFKDRDYIETALEGRRLGLKVFIVIEKPSEIPLVIETARRLRVEPLLGIRMKLSSRGRGKWESSGGDRSKFGLSAGEIVEAVKLLRRRRMLPALQLMHFHIGSQVPDIQRIKAALREAAVYFTEVSRLGAPIRYMDVGGGLAVDYDGSHTNFASSANYDVREYAADVVDAFAGACAEADLPHPTIITESGRALVASHSVLVTEALAASAPAERAAEPSVGRKAPDILRRMAEIRGALTGKNFQETYHDAVEARREALLLFSYGHLGLEDRAKVEALFWLTARDIRAYIRTLDYIPDELEGLEGMLAATYFCNFSIFQSLPDHWAIKQLFPVAPLHRLLEAPTVRGVLADITCDSDGVMDSFVDLRDVRNTLDLHPLRAGEPYYLGVFLVGAYQEILGDLHNLFGDTNVVHVSSGGKGYIIDKTLGGDRIQDVLSYVQFQRNDILSRMRAQVELAIERGAMTLDDSARFMRRMAADLESYTYLESTGGSRA